MPISFEDSIKNVLHGQVFAAVEREREEVVKQATAEFDKRIRKIVGTVAVELSNYYSVQRLGSDLLITVKLTKDSKND